VTAELVVRGGMVVDGTGAPRFAADVAVNGGRITEIGPNLPGRQQLDATGCAVAPGFIDPHTHYDAQVFWDPGLTPSCWHGVTTVIAGNCGFSLAPLRPEHRELMIETLQNVEDMIPATLRAGVVWEAVESFSDYLDAVEQRGVRINFGAYVGHTAVRLYVLGEQAGERPATEEELRSMQELVASALAAGAMGFATSSSSSHKGPGGQPVASRLADLHELETILEPLRQADLGVVAMLPGERIRVEDVYTVQKHLGRPLTWTPMLVMANYPHQDYLEANSEARRHGQDVWAQTAVRPIVFQENLANPFTLTRLPALDRLTGASAAQRMAAYADVAWRSRLRSEAEKDSVPWDLVTVVDAPGREELVGLSVSQLAARQGTQPIDALVEVSLDTNLEARFAVPVANVDPEAVGPLLKAEGVLLGLGDGGAHVGQLCDSCYPTTLLGTWCRDRRVLTLEEAVHKLTAEPAKFLGLAERGRIAVGAAADICVFDPETVASGPLRRVQDLPGGGERLVADQGRGVRHVLVNGQVIYSHGEDVSPAQRPGRVLRSGVDTR
jgi:N-acyl-D-aspartate/D-glutamate deacylase